MASGRPSTGEATCSSGHDDPDVMIRQLKALQRIYTEAGLPDRAYCACAALTVMQAAKPDHVAFYESVAAEDLPVPRAALSEEIWQKVLYHSGEERRLSLLFSCVAPVIALTRAQDGRSFRLKDRYRLEAKTDPSGVARLFDLGASVLSVPRPAVYYNQEFARDAEILNLRDPSGTSPTVAVGPACSQGQGRAGRRLRRRAGPWRSCGPTTWCCHRTSSSRRRSCRPSSTPPSSCASRTRRCPTRRPTGRSSTLFERMLPPQALEPLSSLAPWLTRELAHARPGRLAGRRPAHRQPGRPAVLRGPGRGRAGAARHAWRGGRPGGARSDALERLRGPPRPARAAGHLGRGRRHRREALAPPSACEPRPRCWTAPTKPVAWPPLGGGNVTVLGKSRASPSSLRACWGGRDALFGGVFGVSWVTDAYFVAFRIPNLLRDLFAEGALSSAFVPSFTEALTQQGKVRRLPARQPGPHRRAAGHRRGSPCWACCSPSRSSALFWSGLRARGGRAARWPPCSRA